MSFSRICEAITFDGLSVNRVAALADIPQSSLQRFCAGKHGLQMDGLQRVCQILSLELVRRLDADELQQYLSDEWENEKSEIDWSEYETDKGEAWTAESGPLWESASKELWVKFAAENDLDSHNTDAFQSWAEDAYCGWSEEEWPVWSAEYDEQHQREFESAAYNVWETEKVDRLREVEWIILPS